MKRAIFQAILVGILAACSSSDLDVRKQVEQMKQRPARPVEPLPDMRPGEAFNANYRRDPFKAISAIPRTQSDSPAVEPTAAGPLAGVQAHELRLIRSYWDLDQPAVLVETPDQDLYRLVLGDRVGGFVVSSIEEEKLVLVDGRGRDVTLIRETDSR